MKIYIDAACDVLYASYYIKGFEELKYKIEYNSAYFHMFETNNQFLPIVIQSELSFRKVIIDFGDGTQIDEKAYNWSDVYYKINIQYGDLLKFRKLTSIGPSFGVKFDSNFKLLYLSITNYIKAKNRIPNVKLFFSNYKALMKRLYIEDYNGGESKKEYVFFISSIWKNEVITNNFRLNFIKSCIAIFKNDFEGGFAPRSNGDNFGYDAYVTNSRITLKEYLKNIKKSFVVFNTPAVLHCHGWKMAEYFALGKVIISTSISRELPVKLINNKHFLETDGTQENIQNIINKLLNDEKLYDAISKESKSYYEKFLSPKAVCTFISNN